jgi:hypothetical protein
MKPPIAAILALTKLPALSLFLLQKTMRSATHRLAHGFAPAKFAFWMQSKMSSALLHSTNQIENCEALSASLARWYLEK